MFKSRRFLPLITSLSISSFGNEIQNIAFLWWTLESTGSPLQTAGVASFIILPRFLFGPIAGALVDRHNRQRLLILTELTNCVLMSVTAFLLHLGMLSSSIIYVVVFIQGILAVVAVPSQQALVPELVGSEGVTRANASLQSVRSLSGVLGPALGGMLISFLGVGSVTWLNAISFFLSAILIRLLPSVQGTLVKGRRMLRRDIVDGFLYLAQERRLGQIFLAVMFANLFLTPYIALLPVLARDFLQLEVRGFGLLSSAFFLGVLANSLVISKWGKANLINKIGLGIISVGIFLSLIGFSTGWVLTTAFVMVLGISVSFVAISTVSFLQAYVPNEMRGRVFSLREMSSSGMRTLGITLSGVLAEYMAVSRIFIIAGIIVSIIGALLNKSLSTVIIDISNYEPTIDSRTMLAPDRRDQDSLPLK